MMLSNENNRYRNVLLLTMFIGYISFYIVRKSCTYSIPSMLNDKDLNIMSEDFGLIASTQNLFYTVGKLAFGILADLYSPKLLFSISLCLCGLSNVFFSFGSSTIIFVLCWSVNGFFQGGGWQPIVVLMQRWYSPQQTGTVWSFLSTSMNISSSFIPFLMAYLSEKYSWRRGFLIVGVAACIFSIFSYILINDRPCAVTSEQTSSNKIIENKPISWKILFQSRFLWVFSGAYLLWTFIKMSIGDWLQWYLITEKGFTINQASGQVMSFEIGGLLSCLGSGIVTDYLSRRTDNTSSGYSPRLPYVIFCALFLLLWLFALHWSSQSIMVTLVSFALGFSCYGPHTLFGLIVMESAPDGLVGSAHALAAASSSIGAVMAGYPFVSLVNSIGWPFVLMILGACAILVTCLLLTTASVKASRDKIE